VTSRCSSSAKWYAHLFQWLYPDADLDQLLNVFFDAAVGIVPFIGDFLDIAFKSNVRNLRLLESHLAKSAKKGGLSVELAPTYEQEFANAPSPSRPSAARTAAAPPGGGVNWAALADLARLFSIGGGGAGSRR
jgi:hypothetical protein